MHVALEPEYALFYNRRRGLLYDNRYQPCSQAPSRGRVTFHTLLEGSLSTSNGLEVTGPALVCMSHDVFEGASGSRPETFRAHGEPHVSLTLHIDRDWVVGDHEAAPHLVTLSAEVERAAREYTALAEGHGDTSAFERASSTLIAAFVRDGLLQQRPRVPRTAAQYGERIWNGLSVYVTQLDASPTLGMLSDLINISPRTADRLMKQLTETYGLPAEGFRDMIRRWRLKLATLLLSGRDLTVRVVAQRVGYRNAEALANALAAEGLLAPSRYRQLWDEPYRNEKR